MLNELVPDFSICQMAKEKGVEIESKFVWGWGGDKCEDEYTILFRDDDSWSASDIISAPLTDDILKVLLWEIKYKGEKLTLVIYKTLTGYLVCYQNEDGGIIFQNEDKKLSNALLRLAIKLKEEGII